MQELNIHDAFENYIQNVVVLSGQSTRTEDGFRTSQKVFRDFFNNKPMSALTVGDVRNWHKRQVARNRSINTIRNYLIHIRQVLAYCSANGVDVISPSLVVVPKRKCTIPNVLSKDEVSSVINSIKPSQGKSAVYIPRDKAIVSMLYASGMRITELCKLNRKNLDSRKATIIGKGDKPRLVFWDARTGLLLHEYLKTRNDSNPALFTSPISNQRVTREGLTRMFIKLQHNTGIHVHAHALRHSFATNLMQNGMHIYTISRLMGHESIQTTQKYLHVSDPSLEEEYAKYHSI